MVLEPLQSIVQIALFSVCKVGSKIYDTTKSFYFYKFHQLLNLLADGIILIKKMICISISCYKKIY
jgi:hypothetical protein